MDIDKKTLFNGAAIAIMQKRAAVQTAGLDSADEKLHAEAQKINEGGTPAVATDATGHSNAATFDTSEHAKKPSANGGNKVEDNADTTPRDKVASLSDRVSRTLSTMVSKHAAAGEAGEGDKKLEGEYGKLNLGGSPEGEVDSAQESEANPDCCAGGGEERPSGDVNEDTVGRIHKSASDNVRKIRNLLATAR